MLAALLTWLQGGSWISILAVVLGAACLAIVAPFDAPAPRERVRVVLACMAYSILIGVATVAAQRVEAPTLLMLALVFLLICGTSITCWALATRRRRRIPASHRYYDF